MLESADMPVEMDGNGQESIDIVRQAAPTISFLWICRCPIGEEETTRHLREVGELPEFRLLARVPIVAMTANTALEAGMDSHLATPFNPAALNAILEGLSCVPPEFLFFTFTSKIKMS